MNTKIAIDSISRLDTIIRENPEDTRPIMAVLPDGQKVPLKFWGAQKEGQKEELILYSSPTSRIGISFSQLGCAIALEEEYRGRDLALYDVVFLKENVSNETNHEGFFERYIISDFVFKDEVIEFIMEKEELEMISDAYIILKDMYANNKGEEYLIISTEHNAKELQEIVYEVKDKFPEDYTLDDIIEAFPNELEIIPISQAVYY